MISHFQPIRILSAQTAENIILVRPQVTDLGQHGMFQLGYWLYTYVNMGVSKTTRRNKPSYIWKRNLFPCKHSKMCYITSDAFLS